MHIKRCWHSLDLILLSVARYLITFAGATPPSVNVRFKQWGHRDLNSGLRTPSPQG